MHLKAVKKEMHRNLRTALRGWWFWHRLVKRYRLGRTRVVLLPSCNRQYNYAALRYADQMLCFHKFDDVIFLSVDPAVKTAASLLCQQLHAVEIISRKEAECLMQYYCLLDFDPRFVVGSLDEPNGRNAKGLIGVNGTTVAELIALGVYQLPKFEPEPVPKYTGEDNNVKALLRAGEEEDES